MEEHESSVKAPRAAMQSRRNTNKTPDDTHRRARSAHREIDADERRENAARPHPFLGYNRDQLGLYFLDRGAEHTAEGQFRRAIWLNPFEPEFKLHLAGCLFKQNRCAEAKDLLHQVLAQMPDRRDAKSLLSVIESRMDNRDDQDGNTHPRA